MLLAEVIEKWVNALRFDHSPHNSLVGVPFAATPVPCIMC